MTTVGLLDVEVGKDDISISHKLPPIPPWTDDNGTVHSPPSIKAKFGKRDVMENFYRARYKILKQIIQGSCWSFNGRGK